MKRIFRSIPDMDLMNTNCDNRKPYFFAHKMNSDSLINIKQHIISGYSRLIWIVLLTLISLPSLFAQSLSLSQAVNLALENNPRIRQYQEKLVQKTYADREALGNFLPSIRLQSSYNHLNSPLEIDLSPIRNAMIQMQAGNMSEFANIYGILQGAAPLTPEQKALLQTRFASQLDGVLPPFREQFKDQDFKTATIVGIQPLFLGGKLLAAKKFAAAERQAARAELRKIRQEIIQQTINRYLTVALLNSVVKTRQQVLQGMRRHEKNARRLFEEGLIARYQLLRARVAVAEAERNLSADTRKLELAKTALKISIGLPQDAPLIITDSLHFSPIADSLDSFVKKAFRSQPLLELGKAKQKAADQKLGVERAEFLPQLAGFGKYELYPEYLSVLEPRWVVGVQLNFTLFNGFKRYQKLQAAKHLKKEVRYLNSYLRQQVELWVNRAYRQMRNSQFQLQKLQADMALAEENVRLNEKRFQTGLGTSLEVIDARLSLEKIQVERLKTLFDYNLAVVDLYTATGNLQKFIDTWKNKEATHESE